MLEARDAGFISTPILGFKCVESVSITGSGTRIADLMVFFNAPPTSTSQASRSRSGRLSLHFRIVDADESGTFRPHADGLQDAQRP